MEWFVLFMSVGTLLITYQIFKSLGLSKRHKLEQAQREYAFAKRVEMDETYQNYTADVRRKLKNLDYNRKTNIFREMAIDAIAKQTLVYDHESGQYVRRTIID